MSYIPFLLGAYLALVSAPIGQLSREQVESWTSFKDEHAKTYESQTVDHLRRTIFLNNKLQVDEFNENLSERAGFQLKLNHLADVSGPEIASYNGFKLTKEDQFHSKLINSPEAESFLQDILDDPSPVPDEVDWRKVPGVVSRVKNQGQCGSCWAFSSTGVLEGQMALRKSNSSSGDVPVELSEQNLVDCVKDDYGCNGGLMKDALEFVKAEKGIDDEDSYPYEARTRKCRFRSDKVAFTDAGAAILPEGDEQKLKEVVAKFGPVSVAIDASSIWFMFYHKGVYYNRHCKSKADQLDHAVLVVGYGTDHKKGDYWIVKNSWGPHYGEKGFIRMARNRKNNCGIATVATIPIF